MVKIRRLQSEDIEPVSILEAKSFSMPWSAKDFAKLIEDNNSMYLVAELGGEIVGCCGVTNICGDGDINNVMVAEEYRGRGIAQSLMAELLLQGEAIGIENFTLEVRVSNAPAIRVYEKLGFVSEGIRPGFYERPVEDAMIMWKRKADHFIQR